MKICKFYLLQAVALLVTGNIICVQQAFSSATAPSDFATLTNEHIHSPVFAELNRFNYCIEQFPGNNSITKESYRTEIAVNHILSHENSVVPSFHNSIDKSRQTLGHVYGINNISGNESGTNLRLHITDSNHYLQARTPAFFSSTGEGFLKNNPGVPANRPGLYQPYTYYDSRPCVQSNFRIRLASLPVSIISIKAALKNTAVQINWEAREELNLNLYEVERSTDGINFQTIGLVFPWENPDASSNYRYTDEHPQPGTNYYRLRGVDKDGSFKYSDIVRAGNAPLPANPVSIVPNPVKGNIRAVFSGLAKAAYVVELRTVSGTLLLKKTINIQQADQSETLDPGHVAPGIYWLIIFDQQLQKLGSSRVVIR
ncbi:MAG: hypothetical protein ACTHMC_08540 [Pseudobacter sp.]|uniref:hypothetical protein n=1 Tax=Pseudobacter sp. TaxID=2045420 RepID=UPI003F7DA9F5